MLYSIYADTSRYLYIAYDWKQLVDYLGDEYRFDMDRSIKSYANVWTFPIRVSFSNEGMAGSKMPDISADQGRLFLNNKAFDVLYELLKDDGEFLPVEYGQIQGYIFNPLQLAESVDGLNPKLSIKNPWGDVENIAFDEKKVERFAVFKSEFDDFFSLYCREDIKDAVESANLEGVIFTPDLGNYLGIYGNETN